MTTILTRNPRTQRGSGLKPSTCAGGEKGSQAPIATTTRVVIVSGVLGRLRKKGTRRVRMAKITRLLRGQRLDEPAGAEERCVRVEDPDHDPERGEVKDRAGIAGAGGTRDRASADLGEKTNRRRWRRGMAPNDHAAADRVVLGGCCLAGRSCVPQRFARLEPDSAAQRDLYHQQCEQEGADQGDRDVENREREQ